MSKKSSPILTLFVIFLCLNSLFYYSIANTLDEYENPEEKIQTNKPEDKINTDENLSIEAIQENDVETPGDYKTVAYFTQNNFEQIPYGGYNFVWEEYDEVKNNPGSFTSVTFQQRNDTSNPDRYWHDLDTFGLLWSSSRINNEYVNSIVYSPEFETETYIQGNVYFMVGGECYYSSSSYWQLRIKLQLFNPTTGAVSTITQVQAEYDDTDENPAGSWDGSTWDGWVYEASIPSTTTIPVGYRLRTLYECMITSATWESGALCQIRSGTNTYPTEWTIDSSNDTFDNYYHINNNLESIGIQLYMYQESYPTIDISNIEENVIYETPTNGSIAVSSDAVTSQYKWDSNEYSPFSSEVIVEVPETTGWHTLTVQATDYFDNVAEVSFIVGYDISNINIILNSPANNSRITDGQLLNFTIVDYNTVTYEWDENGTEISFIGPFDIYPNEGFDGVHQLTIQITDNLGTQLHNYFFDFDNTNPEIILVNVANESTLAQGKNIDVIVDDRSYPLDVQYKWDSDSYTDWSPVVSDLYRTYLPETEGWHNLTVFANDTFGNALSKVYSFNTSLTLLNVDLYNLVNNTYYQGGNTIEIAITNDNGTVVYFWDNDPWNTGTVFDGIMTLSGIDALSTLPGTYTLTVIVGNIDNEEVEFRFVFTVDKAVPVIIETYPTYNNSRFLDSDILEFTITDNWTQIDDLNVLYSFDKQENQTLESPFGIYLYGLIDGEHNLTLIATDIAGNYYKYYITFIIDTTSPEVGVTITSEAIVGASRYIPANTEVTVALSDADPIINSYYSWNGSSYSSFFDSFTLPSIEGYARLYILANDSLGNNRISSYWLTIDNTSPTIELILLNNHTTINEEIAISFKVEDLKDDTIGSISSKWDLDEDVSIRTNPEFSVSLLGEHVLYESEAIIYINTSDVVGNTYNCEYHFYLDFEDPTYTLISPLNNTYIRGGDIIEFNVPSTDLNKFYFKWDEDEGYSELEINNTFIQYNISSPIVDGTHTLNIRLEDNTSLGMYPNFIEANFIFIVDDIELIYAEPIDLQDNDHYILNYGEEFNFSVNVRDRINQTEISGLNLDIIKQDLDINLIVSYVQYNATVYNFTIFGSNITDNEYTYIDFEFYQFAENKQIVRVYFKVNRQEGNLLILESTESVIYEENITLSVQLRDKDNITGQEIEYLEIQEGITGFTYELTDPINYIYSITFNSDQFFSRKGSNSIEIFAQSNFYFGVKNDTNEINFTILPIPILLSIEVNNIEIIYGNELVVTAMLTRSDSTPIQFATIIFSFEVHYKNGSINTYNFTTSTNINGEASESFKVAEDMEFIQVSTYYEGSDIFDPISDAYAENILPISGGLSLTIILIIVGAAVLFSIIIGFSIYRLVKPKPFDEELAKVTDEEIEEMKVEFSPGVLLTIFDQSKGPIPLFGDLSLEESKYSIKMRIGTENFMLKIADQAYSSLGFEEHDERRRTGSINLPNEDMVGFIHGIQLVNKAVRGGFENLTLIVLADKEYGGLLLANQEHMFPLIDELIISLRNKEELPKIKEQVSKIRDLSIAIMITALKYEKKNKNNKENTYQ